MLRSTDDDGGPLTSTDQHQAPDPATAALASGPLRPIAEPSMRPWAGRRLGTGVGELWLAGPGSMVEAADGSRTTLDRLAGMHGAALVGDRGLALLGLRFPLLIKVIDAAEWLSLQVHPSDAIAAELHGSPSVGKTEAWVVLEADTDTQLITGPSRDLAEPDLREAIASCTLDRTGCEVREAVRGDAYLLPAGTIHAVGAGLLVYEIEQPSDLTYRISDWGRPPTPGRRLHAAEALRAVDPASHAIPSGSGFALTGGSITVPCFRLEVVTAGSGTSGAALGGPAGPGAALGGSATRAPAGRSLEIVTAVAGRVDVVGDGWRERLAPFETLVVPAAVPQYTIETGEGGMAFVGSVP